MGGSIPSHIAMIANEAKHRGDEVVVASGRGPELPGVSNIRIGTATDVYRHGLVSRLADKQGLASKKATERFIGEAEKLGPDVIHLHNIHGYYLHYPTLFRWLRNYNRPVVWTLHDNWAFTGHCASFQSVNTECSMWQSECRECPFTKAYPMSFVDRSNRNFHLKKELFTSLPNLHIITPSVWLAEQVRHSFFTGTPISVIPHDVDLEVFVQQPIRKKKIVLGVASRWTDMKGLDFFKRLRKLLPEDFEIRLVGRYKGKSPDRISMMGEVTSPDDLARIYSEAILYVNPSYSETYSMTNREALACGTPVVSRRVGGTTEGLETLAPAFVSAESDDKLLQAVIDQINLFSDNKILADSSEAAAKAISEKFRSKPGIEKLYQIYTGLCEHTAASVVL